jgi:hypothetical protein
MTERPRPDSSDVLQKIKAYFAPVAIVSAMTRDVFTPVLVSGGPRYIGGTHELYGDVFATML